jgi:hypothetical protein
MRVSEIYGAISPVPLWNNVVGVDNTIPFVPIGSSSGWSTAGIEGFLQDASYAPYLDGFKHSSYIVAYLPNGGGFNTGFTGAYSFGLDPDFNGALFQLAELHIVACLFNTDGTVGDIAGGVAFTAMWTTDPIGTVSPTWHSFTNGNFKSHDGSTTYVTYGDSTTAIGGRQYPDWEINLGYPDDTYYPAIDYYGSSANGPPSGVDFYIDVTPDLPVFNANFRVKIAVGAVNPPIRGGVSINMMYLHYQLTALQGKTVRDLLAGDHYTVGIIPAFTNSVLNGLVDTDGNTIPLGNYTPIGTNYIMADETTDTNFMIPAYTAVYNDVFQAVQDVIKNGSGLKLLQHQAGYHWKLDTAGNLLVASCGFGSSSHHVQGAT